MAESSTPPTDAAALIAIDAACDRFEAAWSNGQRPLCEDYLEGVAPALRLPVLAELFAIERHYCSEKGQTADRDILCRPRLVALLADLGASPERLLEAAPVIAGAVTLPFSGGALGGGGALRVRCPHCQNGVELLPDAPLESITCHSCGSAFGLAPDSRGAAGEPPSVGRFLLLERLGIGGFGAVWRARDPELQREVAVKLPRRGQLESHELELFWREARAAAQLSHPHIVPVHEVGRDGDRVFIVSELVRGESLASRLKAWRPTPREGATLLATICEALHYAHERGVVHRDLKPSNVMLDGNGAPHVLDFGLAKRDVGEVTMTIEGQVLGTPAYMSPEQAGGMARWIDRRTDIYSLGVMLFQMLTGELPFRGTVQSQIQQRLNDDAPDPRRYAEHTPADLATVCLRCLERDPNRRYSTAGEVAAELRRFLAGEPILARPISPLARGARWARRRPALAASLALGATLAVLGPAAAVLIGLQRAQLAKRLDEITEIVRRDEAKIDLLEQQKDHLHRTLAAGATTEDVTWRTKVAQAFLAKHGERLADQLPQLNGEQRLALGKIYAVAGDTDGAISAFDAAHEAHSEGRDRQMVAECSRLLAEALRKAGQSAKASELERAAVRLAVEEEGASLTELVESLPSDPQSLRDVAQRLGID
jgi:tetratricopeptide (TPR) repeat protein